MKGHEDCEPTLGFALKGFRSVSGCSKTRHHEICSGKAFLVWEKFVETARNQQVLKEPQHLETEPKSTRGGNLKSSRLEECTA